ncbi:MAG: hypothetical protein F6K19_25500, partial [Cyanothece sp. SIO1E1]|nr:hypothetical protein [Cyanothece sp. SIO1E1]
MKKTATIALLLSLLFSSLLQGQINISAVEIEQVEGNVLRYRVSFTTDEMGTGYLEYGEGLYTEMSANKTQHQLILIGLAQLTDYQIKIHAFNGSGATEAGPYTISTDSIPSDIVETADSL